MGSATLCSIAEFLQDSFDFTVVGGGTAGLVVAARLSEDPNVRVGVIEAGVSRLEDPNVQKLTGMSVMLNNPEYDWAYRSVPQEGNKCRVHHIPRGKMLGGSSGINFMAYGRPSIEDIDDWATALGNKGWSWSELAPYYRKSEKLEFEERNIKNRDPNICPLLQEYHGTEGAIHTSLAPWQASVESSLLPCFDETSKISRPVEPWSGKHLGFYRSLFTVDRTSRPSRSYAANGYLAPIMGRPNLKILTKAVASKVLLDEEKACAKGVEFYCEEAFHRVFSKREVILCGGSIESPKLLELSGIGDPNVLNAAGVSCLVPLAEVGSNLQEKPVSAVVYELASGGTSVDSLFQDTALFQEHQKLYMEKHDGALAGAISLMGFIPYCSQVSVEELDETISKILSPGSEDPIQNSPYQKKQRQRIIAHLLNPQSADIQCVGIPTNFAIDSAYSNCSKLSPGPPPGRNACYSIMFSSMYPVSRGNVHIQSSDPLEPPRIDLGFLSHPADIDIMAAGVAFADRVFKSGHMQDKVAGRVEPAPDVDLQNRCEARKYVQEKVLSYHHGLGSCAMGQVVDDRLRVLGVKRLRVVDASVLPAQLSHAIVATVYAVAEKAADIIKEDNALFW
ncbi:GMC oxidoreductase [Glonium stellatum]|uniref:GMC oxidoreductase n=1 Tax=Glonium stellatum TaxID=574774 RepID=A0A8E2JMX0_9PEZI|nr:GMC oxidoreductase [Glonium stellatum]